MSDHSFHEASDIYTNSVQRKVYVHSVSSANLQTFNRNLSKLFKTVSDSGSDAFWSPIISTLKRFRFDMSAAPLSKYVLSERARILGVDLKGKVPYCGVVYSPELALLLKLLAEQAQQLSESAETNLLDFLTELVRKDGSKEIAIAVSESRLIPYVEETIMPIAGLKSCGVVCPSNLKEAKCYSNIYLIGAPRWFPEFVFSSPRSKELHIIKHKWISGNWKPETVLASLYKHQGDTSQQIEIIDADAEFIEDDPKELIPQINLQYVLDKALEQSVNLMNDDNDVVLARLFLLENDWAVFLDADDNSSIDIIDLDEELEKRVRRVAIREVQPGVFILLRMEGGGDYIVPVADRIMGNFKEKARSDQHQWKTLLREYVKKEGKSKSLNGLRSLGSKRATYLNLEHWMSYRGIRTESYDDFLAIMKLIGLEKDALRYWETMGKIRVAHTRAGFTIRTMLLDQVNKSDIAKLKHYGKMDFQLGEAGAGSLSAFRVKEIIKDTVEVIHWRIGEPFRVQLEVETVQAF